MEILFHTPSRHYSLENHPHSTIEYYFLVVEASCDKVALEETPAHYVYGHCAETYASPSPTQPWRRGRKIPDGYKALCRQYLDLRTCGSREHT